MKMHSPIGLKTLLFPLHNEPVEKLTSATKFIKEIIKSGLPSIIPIIIKEIISHGLSPIILGLMREGRPTWLGIGY